MVNPFANSFYKILTMKFIYLFLALLLVSSCAPNSDQKSKSEQKQALDIEKSGFGKLKDGFAIDLYTLKNVNGMTLKITNYGGAIVSWTAPDKNGKYEDIVLGCDSVSGYENGVPYFGAFTSSTAPMPPSPRARTKR